jgi:hypothetical protein
VATAPEIILMRGVVVDLHKTNNFAPNEFRGVVNSSGLVVYKGSNARDKKVLVKVKTER